MTSNLTANNFKDLSLFGKIKRVCNEPQKASTEFLYKALSIVGHRHYIPFVILTRDRTGSNMLVQYLNSHPSIRCQYEALGLLNGMPGPTLIKKLYGKQPFFICAKGFKIFYYHPMDADEYARSTTWSELENIPNLRLIHLRRCNILETAVSSKLAYETGIYGDLTRKSSSVPASVPSHKITSIEYPADKLQLVFQQTRRWEEEWPKRFSGCPQLDLTYEGLIVDPETELARVCRFLGITQPFKPHTNFRKQRTKSLRQSLINYDALKHHFATTTWAEFFTD
jgi:LPS sulfotransferase NodH